MKAHENKWPDGTLKSNSNCFDWNTGSKSIFFDKAAERVAKKIAKGGMDGKCTDSLGRATVDIAPRTKNSIDLGNKRLWDAKGKI